MTSTKFIGVQDALTSSISLPLKLPPADAQDAINQQINAIIDSLADVKRFLDLQAKVATGSGLSRFFVENFKVSTPGTVLVPHSLKRPFVGMDAANCVVGAPYQLDALMLSNSSQNFTANTVVAINASPTSAQDPFASYNTKTNIFVPPWNCNVDFSICIFKTTSSTTTTIFPDTAYLMDNGTSKVVGTEIVFTDQGSTASPSTRNVPPFLTWGAATTFGAQLQIQHGYKFVFSCQLAAQTVYASGGLLDTSQQTGIRVRERGSPVPYIDAFVMSTMTQAQKTAVIPISFERAGTYSFYVY